MAGKETPETNFDAQAALQGYEGKYLECRDLRHAWTLKGCFRRDGEVLRVLICGRCATERIDRWTNKAEIVRASYRYPEGYQLRGGHVRPYDVRKETLSRVTVFASEQDMVRSVMTAKRRNPQKD